MLKSNSPERVVIFFVINSHLFVQNTMTEKLFNNLHALQIYGLIIVFLQSIVDQLPCIVIFNK